MPETITSWGAAAWAAIAVALSNLLGWVPNLLGAILILLIGWGIASLLGKLTDRALDAIHFDRWMAKAHLDEAIARSGMRIEPSNLVANLVKWAVFLVAVLVASDALGLAQVTTALTSVIAYIPNVIAAILIVGFGGVLASFVGNLVKAAPVSGSRILGQVAYWSVMVFAVLAALTQLNIAPGLVQTLFTALIGSVALAAAIAFGLGLRRQAEDLAVSAGLKQVVQTGDTISVRDLEGNLLTGEVIMIGPSMTSLATSDGTMLIPNRMLSEDVLGIRSTAGVPTRMNVTRMPETVTEQAKANTMNRPGQPPV